jgi:hypothetical protein
MIRISKSAVNIREKLAELERPIGINGAALMATNTPQDAFSLIGARNRNLIINGGMTISQRGTSFSPTGTSINYNVDRFFTQQNGTNNFTITQSSDAPPGFTNSLLLTMGTATTLDYMRVGTSIEGYNISNLSFGTSNAKTFTLSFWVKCSLSGTFGVGFRNGTSTDGSNLTLSRLASYTINNANTWEYKTITIPGPTSSSWGSTNGLGMIIMWDIGDSDIRSSAVNTSWTNAVYYPVGLLGGTKVASRTGATWQITGVQLEEGKVATPFEYRSYGEELALCQRYYQAHNTTNGVWNVNGVYGWMAYPITFTSSTSGSTRIMLPTSMRTNPTTGVIGSISNNNTSPIVGSNGTIGLLVNGLWAGSSGTGLGFNGMNPTETTTTSFRLDVNGSGFTVGNSGLLYFYGTEYTSTVTLRAEL